MTRLQAKVVVRAAERERQGQAMQLESKGTARRGEW
jgi:hypothetical protein